MIVVNVAGRVVGLVVDSVLDIITLPRDSIRLAPETASTTFATRYITGLRAVHDRILIHLERNSPAVPSSMVHPAPGR